MAHSLKELLQLFNGNEGATNSAIENFRLNSGITLPSEYEHFLRFANGGEGFIGKNSYVIFWKLEELIELNKAYEVSEYAPGIFLLGSDGGGEAYGFDMIKAHLPIVKMPFVGMTRDLVLVISSNFNDFLDALYEE